MENLVNTYVKVSKDTDNRTTVTLTLTLLFTHVKGLKAERETEESHIFLFIAEMNKEKTD